MQLCIRQGCGQTFSPAAYAGRQAKTLRDREKSKGTFTTRDTSLRNLSTLASLPAGRTLAQAGGKKRPLTPHSPKQILNCNFREPSIA